MTEQAKLLVAVSAHEYGAGVVYDVCVIEVCGSDAAKRSAPSSDDIGMYSLSMPDEPGLYVWEGEFDTERPSSKQWRNGKWRFPNAEELAKIGEGKPLWS